MTRPLSRRLLLRRAAFAGAGAAVWPLWTADHDQAMAQAVPLGVSFDDAPFTIGVASGDPLPDSVIIWTRLAPEPLTSTMERPSGDLPDEVEVEWVVATDQRLRRVVASGTAPARAVFGHAVQVDVRGLEPGETYWYRFAYRGAVSRIGRTRTAPAGPTDRFRFAFASCQAFPSGFYGAYRGMAREDLDLVVHLGDYIYEGGGDGEGRSHTGPQIQTVAQYRNRYALYRGDPSLRAAHAAFPWVFTWDDHEVDNNYAALVPENTNAEEGNDEFALRRAAAYQVYYEQFPIRVGPDGTGFGLPTGPDFRIYRRFSAGDLLDIDITDTRQYRSDQLATATSGEAEDPSRTMLGDPQKAWLKEALGREVRWRAIANQTMMAQLEVAGLPEDVGGPLGDAMIGIDDDLAINPDQWDGYRAERRELLAFIRDEQIPNVVTITGDIHSHWVADLKVDFDDPTDPIVATEFVGTSISTSGFPDGSDMAVRALIAPTNRHFRYFEGERHGYAVVDVTPEQWRTTYRVVEDLDDPNSRVEDLAAFEVADGRPGADQISGGGGQPPRVPPRG